MRLLFAILAVPVMAAAAASDCAIDGIAVSSVGGAPVPRVNVTLIGAKATVTVRADENGRWSFSDAPCGVAAVNGVRPGFIQNIAARGVLMKPVSLVSGTPVHDYRLEMIPQAVLTGKVTDEHGDALMNVVMVAMTARVVDGKRTFQNVGGTNTNDLGQFRLAGLAAGRYIFCANPGGGTDFSRTAPEQSCYPSAPEPSGTSALQISAGSEVNVNFIVRNAPAFHVRGTILGTPAGMRASVVLTPAPGEGGYQHHAIEMTPNGGFDIAGVRAGSYILSADTSGVRDGTYARVTLQVGGADVEDIVLRLEPTFEIPVTIKVESGKGNTIKEVFRVGARRPSEPTQPAFRISRFTIGASGFTGFNISGVTPGPMDLDAFPPAPFYLKSALYAGRDLAAGEVTVLAAAPVEMVLSDDAGALEGDVESPEGKPAACGITLLRNGRARVVTSNESGHFKLTGVAPGDYVAYAWSDYQEAEYANPDWLRRFAGVAVRVAAGQTATVKLVEQAIRP